VSRIADPEPTGSAQQGQERKQAQIRQETRFMNPGTSRQVNAFPSESMDSPVNYRLKARR
jgi:hypothetical protein